MKKKLPKYYNKLFPCLLILASFFMGIGYAAINSSDMFISGDLVGVAQKGIFISEVKLVDSSGVDTTKLKYSSYQTMLENNIELSNYSSDSFVTYEIVIRNEYNMDFTFLDVVSDADFYSNEDIVFYLDGLSEGDIISSNGEIKFNLTFKYKDGVTSIENNELNSYLNFRFIHPVLYIESDGTQYIDTGIVAHENLDFDITFSLDRVDKIQAIFGSRYAMDYSDGYNFWLYQFDKSDNLHHLRWDLYGIRGEAFDLAIGEDKMISANKRGLTVTVTTNGRTASVTNEKGTLNSKHNVYLFNQNQIHSPEDRLAYMKLYDFKLYFSGELVRDFIPVLDQNGKACLYDKVSSSYFYSVNGNSFGYGTENNIYEYIQNSGTQYIDLEVSADSKTEVQYAMAINSYTENTNGIFGSRVDQIQNAFNMFLYKGYFRWDYFDKVNKLETTVDFTKSTFLRINSTMVNINREVIEFNFTDEITVKNNMYLFAVNSSGNAIYINEGMKIYFFKVIQDGIVVRNLVPAKDSSGVACFYDLVSKRYFYNKGTGSFILG